MIRRFCCSMILTSMGIAACMASSNSAAKVIAVLGKSESITPFYANTATHVMVPSTKKPNSPYQFHYQTQSKLLSPGNVISKTASIGNIPQPIFIVGTGKRSIEWLKRYASRLKQLHAIGLVVNVPSNQAYQNLAQQFHIHLLPMNADALAKRFGVTHYPVLISAKRIEQ